MRTSRLSMAAALFFSAAAAQAQQEDQSRWTVGALSLGYISPFEADNTNSDGENTASYNVFPFITYHSDTFFFEGTEAGYHLFQQSDAIIPLQLDVIVAGRILPGKAATSFPGTPVFGLA